LGSNLKLTKKNEAIARLNRLGGSSIPFTFYCDFLGERWCIEENSLPDASRSFQLEIGEEHSVPSIEKVNFQKYPVDFSSFQRSFKNVVSEINFGNSFLTNLTFQTPVEIDLTLEEIYKYSKAKYKLHAYGEFVVFSPETFIKIEDNAICSYPMKGTIDASIPYAKERILADLKETAEHVTIVDLIRNDLSQVAENVEVTRFRFIDEIETNERKLLQVSSEIKGNLSDGWKENVGGILSKLLPAGSITGAPKPKTVRIIQENEHYERGFYTGICGYFDGKTLDTGVMIRFIHQLEDQLYYCSGGGITSFSEVEKEYKEMIDKVYLAF